MNHKHYFVVNWTWYKQNGPFTSSLPWKILEPHKTDKKYDAFLKKDILMIIGAASKLEVSQAIAKLHKHKNIKPVINWSRKIDSIASAAPYFPVQIKKNER